MNKFLNPYRDLPRSKLTRIAPLVSTAHHDFFFLQVHPGHGSLTTTINLLFSKLYDALQQQSITAYATDRERFEQFLAECVIGLPQGHQLSRSPSGGTMPETAPSNVPRRTKGVRARPKVIKGVSTDLQGTDSCVGK
jgi:hypothetical protein